MFPPPNNRTVARIDEEGDLHLTSAGADVWIRPVQAMKLAVWIIEQEHFLNEYDQHETRKATRASRARERDAAQLRATLGAAGYNGGLGIDAAAPVDRYADLARKVSHGQGKEEAGARRGTADELHQSRAGDREAPRG
jgi:hypothetical protein